ncbi:MAG TPA: class I SAM-dependent methyltransferase, partial [Daejeonella sp.]|nr:class I SAM-dependent methyltransferase [Daejeonella sp.]
VDFSEQMLAKAIGKVDSARVQFQQADITQKWSFGHKSYQLVSFSLVLEHIENIEPIFEEVSQVLLPGGYIYIGELHPFKQYSGSKARFDTAEGQQILTCFNHHVSEFTQLAKQYGFEIVDLNEFFDENDRSAIPRILTLLLRKR